MLRKIMHVRILLLILIPLFCAVGVTSLSSLDFMRFLEHRSYDLLFLMRGTKDPGDEIIIIGVDEDSFRNIEEPLALWGPRYAELIMALKKAGARIIGIDILQIVRVDDYIREDLEKKGVSFDETIIDYDERFATALNREPKNVILSSVLTTIPGKELPGIIEPIPRLKFSAGPENTGFVTTRNDSDDFVRKQTLLTPIDGMEDQPDYPSMSLLISARYLQGEIRRQGRNIAIGNRVIQADEQNSNLINFAGPSGSFPIIPFHRSLQIIKNDPGYFRNKIILLGFVDKNITQDMRATPFYSLKRPGMPQKLFGTELLANCIRTILDNSAIRPVNPGVNFAVVFGLSLCTSLICFFMKPLRGTLSIILLYAGFLATAIHFFDKGHLWIEISRPATAIFLSYALTFVYRYINEDREKSYIRNVFKSFVSATVAEEMLKNPASLELGGKKTDMSIFFTDINDFTPFCETHPAEVVVEILNEYYSSMEKVIFKYNGTIVNYVGDEIMAVFGAPIPTDTHALDAVRAGIEIHRKTREWIEERNKCGQIYFTGIKTGIHTGSAVVGLIGSSSKKQYTAIGTLINTAARIESLNKTLGTEMLISEDTYRQVKDDIIIRDMGDQKLKGITGELKVYEPVGLMKDIMHKNEEN